MIQSVILREMSVTDLDQVSQIDRHSFPLPWSKTTYMYEILENDNANMIVVSRPPKPEPVGVVSPVEPESGSPLGGFQKMLRRFRFFGVPKLPHTLETVVGLGGFWCAVGEAHISTIAVHPDWRGHGLGEVMLAGMLKRGIALGANESVLEVRVSNKIAINLYRKYEYKVLTKRPNYYRDNNEDAWLMQVDLTKDYRKRLERRIQTLYARLSVIDKLNSTKHV